MIKQALKRKISLVREKTETRETSSLFREPEKKFTKTELEAFKKRDELIAEYMPYAASIASRVYQSLSKVVEYDEVLSSARLGLLEASKRYNKGMGVDFKTFAYYRIKGAIYDGLRKAGWIPRTLYAKLKFEEAANDYLQFMSDHADSRLMDTADEEIAETVNSLASIYIISFDAQDDFDVEDTSTPCLEQSAEFRQVRKYMRDAINDLPPTEKKLVKMYYFQNKTLEEVGRELNMSKSWTSRLHARALELLLKKVKVKASDEEEGEKENHDSHE